MSERTTSSAVLPDGLRHLAGHILDVDSHEMMPVQVWKRECGSVVDRLVDAWMTHDQAAEGDNKNNPNIPGYVDDDSPIDAATIWLRKGPGAPGAVDVGRRDTVMDAMGIERQLMFPTGVGMYGIFVAALDEEYGYLKNLKVSDRREYGLSLVSAYNTWGKRVAKQSPRVRPVLPVVGDSVEELIATARDVIAAGIRAIWLPSNWLPGGKSPASDLLDPFWQLMTDNKIAVCLHVGVESQIYGTDEWSNAPAFKGFRFLSEFKIDPWSRTHAHIMSQNFLSTMVLGGVFERHPELRFGVIELGAYWLGPLCETMDLWYQNIGILKGSGHCYRLPKKPSDYIRSNVRVSAFDFEEVDTYITRYGLQDVLCFASDYPHIEGGKDPAGTWYKRLAPMGEDIVQKFFATNAKWLLPD